MPKLTDTMDLTKVERTGTPLSELVDQSLREARANLARDEDNGGGNEQPAPHATPAQG